MNEINTLDGFCHTLQKYERTIARLLEQKYGITAQDFMETCILAVKKTPRLLECDPRSLFGAILLSAECGLKPNTAEQLAFILPSKNEARFEIGYKGLIEMMYRNPRVQSIRGEVVFVNDEFDYGYGLEPYINHKPLRRGDRGALDCVYAVCKLKDAEPIFTVVEKNELDKIRAISQSSKSEFSPYNNGTDIHNFMEIKASIKKISKLIPKSGDNSLAKAVDYDSRFEGGARVTVDLIENPETIVEPKIIDGSYSVSNQTKSLENSFENVISDKPVSYTHLTLPTKRIV